MGPPGGLSAGCCLRATSTPKVRCKLRDTHTLMTVSDFVMSNWTDLHFVDQHINVNGNTTDTCPCVWRIFHMKFVDDNPSEKSVALTFTGEMEAHFHSNPTVKKFICQSYDATSSDSRCTYKWHNTNMMTQQHQIPSATSDDVSNISWWLVYSTMMTEIHSRWQHLPYWCSWNCLICTNSKHMGNLYV